MVVNILVVAVGLYFQCDYGTKLTSAVSIGIGIQGPYFAHLSCAGSYKDQQNNVRRVASTCARPEYPISLEISPSLFLFF